MALSVGDMAPDFTVRSDKMFKINLAGLRGHKLLLLFFSAGLYQHLKQGIVLRAEHVR